MKPLFISIRFKINEYMIKEVIKIYAEKCYFSNQFKWKQEKLKITKEDILNYIRDEIKKEGNKWVENKYENYFRTEDDDLMEDDEKELIEKKINRKFNQLFK